YGVGGALIGSTRGRGARAAPLYERVWHAALPRAPRLVRGAHPAAAHADHRGTGATRPQPGGARTAGARPAGARVRRADPRAAGRRQLRDVRRSTPRRSGRVGRFGGAPRPARAVHVVVPHRGPRAVSWLLRPRRRPG